jgi:hypothetical protein
VNKDDEWMTSQIRWDATVTAVIIVLSILITIGCMSCELRKCPKGEVKIDGKCYVPGASYLKINGAEKPI